MKTYELRVLSVKTDPVTRKPVLPAKLIASRQLKAAGVDAAMAKAKESLRKDKKHVLGVNMTGQQSLVAYVKE